MPAHIESKLRRKARIVYKFYMNNNFIVILDKYLTNFDKSSNKGP